MLIDDNYTENRDDMCKKVLDTWGHDELHKMYEDDKLRNTKPYFLFSKNLKHVWLISGTRRSNYNHNYEDTWHLILSLTSSNNYDLLSVAGILRIPALDVFSAIGSPNRLDYLLPKLELKDVIEEEKLNDRNKQG